MRNRYYGFDTANKFVDFHPFPLSIDKNHLIAINFYRCRFLSIDYSGTSVNSVQCPLYFNRSFNNRNKPDTTYFSHGVGVHLIEVFAE